MRHSVTVGRFAALCLALASLAGCSNIPQGFDPPASLGGEIEPLDLRLAIAPCTISMAQDEVPKEYQALEVVNTLTVSRELARWIGAAEMFPAIRLAEGSTREEHLDDSWAEKDDLLLQVELADFRTKYEGHNNWYIPNLINWFMFLFPAWFVATEEYTLSFTAKYQITSVGSGRRLSNGAVEVSVGGSFDEFDRGWQFFGFASPLNEAENWRLIAGNLLPAARSQLGRKLAEAFRGPIREDLTDPARLSDMRKTLAVVVGVTHYQDANRYPPVAHAGTDARAVAAALTDPVSGSDLASRQVTLLVGGDATQSSLEAAVAQLESRAREGDQILFYFAGYGIRGSKRRSAYVLLNDPKGAWAVSLAKLGAMLGRVPGDKLLVFDCGFDGQGRSKARKAVDGKQALAEAEALAKAAGGVVFMSTTPGAACLAPDHLAAGLFTHHLVAGLRGAADRDATGRVTHAELYAYLTGRVAAESAYIGKPQTTLAAGLGARPFELSCGSEPEE